MPPQPIWLSLVDLACASLAGALWYAYPAAGPLPLLPALVPWAIRVVISGRLTAKTPFDLPILLFLVTAAVSVWSAYDRDVAWAKFWLIVGAVLLFYALANAAKTPGLAAWYLAGVGATAALYYLMTGWGTDPGKLEALDRLGRSVRSVLPTLPGPDLNANILAGVMVVCLPFAGWVAQRPWGRRGSQAGRQLDGAALPATAGGAQRRGLPAWLEAGVGLLLLLVTALGLLMTASRGAWLALGTTGVVAAGWLLAGWIGRGDGRRRVATFLALMAAALVLAVVLTVTPAGADRLVAWLNALPGPSPIGSRLDLLRQSVVLGRDYPFVGAGLGGFQMLHSSYALLIHVGYITHSHNLLLDVSIEQGLPGLLALAAAWLIFAWRLLAGAARREGRLAPVTGAAALSLVATVAHGLTDDTLYSSGGVLLLFACLAVLSQRATGRRIARGAASLIVPLLLVACMAAALAWRGPALALAHSNLGAVHQGQAELRVYAWPEWPIQDAVRRAVDLGRPMAEYERALALDPGNYTANRRLGQIELSLGRYEAAQYHLEAALASAPGDPATRMLLGEAYLANGRQQEGAALWADASNAAGQLDARIWWYGYLREEDRERALRRAVEAR